VAVQRASVLVAGAPANAGPRAAAVDWADAVRSGTPDAWAHAVRLGDGGVARAALSVLAAPVQLDVGPNRVRVLVRVALP
jgi:hypothetical protein